MAEVFAGHALGSHGFQKPVAIKRLLPELANDHVFVDRLIGEAKLLVGMTHGNVVSVLDLARDGEDVFLVMEYVDGPSLRQLIKARGSRMLSLGIASYIVQSAAGGLEFAHARPGGAVIHADISPSNLLLTTSGEVRVADFGIARREGVGEGIVEGKWAYMAPEQARGEPLTPRCDVFALGVVLYELITGRHPFGGQVSADGRDESIRMVPPRVVVPSVPPGLDAICMRMLATDPQERYSRMQQVIDAIVDERFANGWREAASDLASAIRECGASPAAPQISPRTMITERPLTIVTRSLISEPSRASESRISDAAIPVLDSGARTRMIDLAAEALPMPALPVPDIRSDGTPPQPPRLSAKVLPNPELTNVHGGNTMAGEVALPARNVKWALAILAAGAIIGIAAAVIIELMPDPSDAPPPPPEVRSQIVIPEATHVDPAPTPTPAPAPAPAQPETVAVAPPPPPPVEPPAKQPELAVTPPPETPAPTPAPPRRTHPPTTPRPTPAPKHPREAPAGTGTLVVSSDPWAKVTIDGDLHGETPYIKFDGLARGHHTVRLENGLTRVVLVRHVQISPGEVTPLKIRPEDWP